MYNTPKIFTPQELPSEHPLRKMVYYPCDKTIINKLKIDFRKFSIGGNYVLKYYFKNKHHVDYVKFVKTTKKSIYLKVYYAPRREVYYGYFCDYQFKVLHVLGGCKGNYIYIYTYVLKEKSCDRNYERAVWGLHGENFEIIVHRINLVSGEVESESFSNTIPEMSGELDYIDYKRYVQQLREKAIVSLVKNFVMLGKKYGIVLPEFFEPFYMNPLMPGVVNTIHLPGKYNNVEVDIYVELPDGGFERLHEKEVFNKILDDVVELFEVFNKLKKPLMLDNAFWGEVMIEKRDEKVNYEYKIAFGDKENYMIAYHALTIQFPTVVPKAYNIYMRNYFDEALFSRMLVFHFKQAGFKEYAHAVKQAVELLKKCPPVHEGVLIYVRGDIIGVYGDSKCRVFRIQAMNVNEFAHAISKFL